MDIKTFNKLTPNKRMSYICSLMEKAQKQKTYSNWAGFEVF